MRKMILAIMMIAVLLITGCTGEKLSSKDFLKEMALSSLQFSGMNQQANCTFTIKLGENVKNLILQNLDPSDPFSQFAFFILENDEISANFDLNVKMKNIWPMELGGDVKASVNIDIPIPELNANFYIDASPQGGFFYSLDNVNWEIISTGSPFQAGLSGLDEEFDLEKLSKIKSWDDLKNNLSEEQYQIFQDFLELYLNSIEVISDVSKDNYRTITAEFQYAKFMDGYMQIVTESEYFKDKYSESFDDEVFESFDEFIGLFDDIKIDFVITAVEKTRELKEIHLAMTIDQNNKLIAKLSELMGLDETLDLSFNYEINSKVDKLSADEEIRPASLTKELKEALVEKYIAGQVEQVEMLLEIIGISVQDYFNTNDIFPESLEEAVGEFLLDSLIDPFTMEPYKYQYTEDEFKIYSAGPDGEYDTEDDIIYSNSVK